MRKFTLFFMSMFLVLGTAMAKDEESKEDKGFTLVSADPNSNTPVQIVDIIRLTFSKDITVTLPEGGIEVTNENTKESIKIASILENPYLDKNVVIFQFEKKTVIEDGKEEQKEQNLSTPGKYSYTIPEGVIKSVDNEVFPETTLTFTIATFFEIADWSPKEANEAVTELVFTFDKEITDVNLPESGFKCFQNYQYLSPTYLLVKDTNISKDKKSVTFSLETFLTDFGYYDVDIPLGTFISGEEVSMSKSIWFNIVDPAPSFSTNYKDGDKVRIVEKKCGECWAPSGRMDKWLGKVMTIRKVFSNGIYLMAEDVHEFYGGWCWHEHMIAGLATEQPKQKVVITTDGKTTLARLYDGKKVIDRAEAKCHPEDKFDLTIGAKLAFERLMDRGDKKEKPTPEVPKTYNGKIICVESPYPWWTVGKIYEVIDGIITDDKGDKYPFCGEPYKDAEDLRHAGCGSSDLRHSRLNTFIPLVEMPW